VISLSLPWPFLAEYRKYATASSKFALTKDVLRFPSVCIVSSDPGEPLDGWVLTREDGSIGVLHTADRCRRRGYARAMLQYMLRAHDRASLDAVAEFGKLIEAEGMTELIASYKRRPFCYTARWNAASTTLFSRFGFRKAGGANWLWPVRGAPPPPSPSIRLYWYP
jgi:hypothetical protein